MADRFPLILNTSTNQIQEIPSGDNLDLTGVGINNAGIITAGNVVVGASTTDLIVTGDARITGILTVGTGSLTLNGPNNLVNVGTALTLGHTQGLQFHTQNLHSAGFEVNQINASGIITATEADINGDLDVDGHTNLDNVSVAGVSTFAGNADFSAGIDVTGNLIASGNLTANNGTVTVSGTAPKITFTETNDNPDYKLEANGGNIAFVDTTNSATRLSISSSGINVTGNGTFSGNVSIGGTLTYEDVTNIDSIGIITARNGLTVSSGTATFQGAIDANGDLDVDGHTNLDNVSIAGVVTATTFVGALTGNATSSDTVDISGAGNANTEFYVTFSDTNGAAKTIKIDDGLRFNASSNVLTASFFSGNGANLSGLNGSQISSGTVPVARIGTGTKSTSTFYRGDGTFATVTAPAITAINSASNNRLVTSDGGTTVTAEADITYNGTSLGLAAGKDIRLTTGTWTGEHAGKIQYHSNKMYLQGGTSGHQLRDNVGNTTLEIAPNGTCAGVDLTLAQDVTFNGGAGAVTIGANSDIRFTNGSWTGEHPKIQLHGDLLYICGGTHTNYAIAFRDNNGSDRFYMDDDGHLTPAANNQYDLGNSSYRWRNIYTNDLNLSNEGGKNEVDGTWGNYTIQEGESDLFLINKRSGKKYKFNLTEVS